MHYLKCLHCNHNNPFKSEYLTFCESCGKKLDNNFIDWKKNHPQGTLEIYRNEICNTEEPQLSVKLKQPSFLKSKLLKFSIALVLLSAILFYITNYINTSGTPGSVLRDDWHRYTYGDFGISIEAPEKLARMDIQPAPAYAEITNKIEAFRYHPLRGFQIELKCTQFKKGLNVNLPAASLSCINELSNKPGISNLEFHETVVRTDDIPGIFTEGTYFDNGNFMRFENSIHSKGEQLWQVFIRYRYDDKNGWKASERVMKSLDINFFMKVI